MRTLNLSVPEKRPLLVERTRKVKPFLSVGLSCRLFSLRTVHQFKQPEPTLKRGFFFGRTPYDNKRLTGRRGRKQPQATGRYICGFRFNPGGFVEWLAYPSHRKPAPMRRADFKESFLRIGLDKLSQDREVRKAAGTLAQPRRIGRERGKYA